jgi:ribosome-binding factor A
MTRSENGREIRARVKGKVEFNDDYSDIKSLTPGGSLRISEKLGSASKRLEVEVDRNGALQRSYFVNDTARSFDQEARQWVSGMMLELVRQSGFDVERRAERIFQRGGASAVLEEITLIKSDYVKKLYFRELLDRHQLNTADASRAVRQMAKEISSDYEKRQALSKVAEKYLGDQTIRSEFIAAAGTVSSDYERGQIFHTMLKQGPLTSDEQTAALKVVAGISSDYEKARVLIRMIEVDGSMSASPAAFFETVNGIGSDYEHARVLLAFLSHGKPQGEALKLAVKSAANISSDYEKARVLVQVATISRDDEEIRRALIEATKSISSDYHRGRVLTAAFK